MPFTDLETVRKHLVAAATPAAAYANVLVTLKEVEPVALPHAHLQSGLLAKWLAADPPTRETSVMLVNEDPVSLAQKDLERGSVAVALDLGLSAIYDEERDYRLDYNDGIIQRLATGAIPNSVTVVVWYNYYERVQETTDFIVDYAAGTIRRTSSGAIPDGATILVDYAVAQGSAEDALIEQAIVEAQDIVVRSLREGYSASSTDQGLKTGTIYLTLSIVARGMAALMLTRNSGSDAYSRAREWQQLSDKWTTAAWNVLAPFIRPNAMRSTVVE